MAEPTASNTLCPVDFSDISADALRFARQWTPAGGRLHIIHAHWVDVPPYFTESQVQDLKTQATTTLHQADRHLRAFAGSVLGAAEGVETRVVEGAPVAAILDAATDSGADWIVMGTHGRTGWNRWTLGSVAERVVRESRIPVITVHSYSGKPVRRILCPVQDSELSRGVLTMAVSIASRMQAELTVLHVAEPHSDRGVMDVCSWVDQEAWAHCSIREVKREGNPAQEILNLSQAGEFDLIVMGAPRRNFFEGMVLGSTVLRVMRHARCPVLTIPGA